MDDENINFTNSGDFLQKFALISDFMQKVVEDLVKEEMLTIYVDTDGTFYYKATDKYIQDLKKQHEEELIAAQKVMSFSEIVNFQVK